MWCGLQKRVGVFNPLTGGFLGKTHFWTFWRFSAWIWAHLAPMYSKRHFKHDIIRFFSLAPRFTTFLLWNAQKSKIGCRTRKWPTSSSLSFFFYFSSPFLVPLVLSFLRRWFYWACFQSKNVRESIIRQFLPWSTVVAGNLAVSFLLKFLSIFVHISGSIELITLTSLERSFPPAEFKYRWCQFWLKVMTSEVEQRLTHVAGYGRRSSQWAEMAQSGRIKK